MNDNLHRFFCRVIGSDPGNLKFPALFAENIGIFLLFDDTEEMSQPRVKYLTCSLPWNSQTVFVVFR